MSTNQLNLSKTSTSPAKQELAEKETRNSPLFSLEFAKYGDPFLNGCGVDHNCRQYSVMILTAHR
jgi:hypothetical protein